MAYPDDYPFTTYGHQTMSNDLGEKAHAIVHQAATRVRKYLDTCGAAARIEEIVTDGENGEKVCALNIYFTLTGKEVIKSENRSV